MKFDLKKWRKQMGRARGMPTALSTTEAAMMLGYTVGYLSHIERGYKSMPRLMPDACENILRKEQK